ncbi:MAG: hypothetical protein H8D23_14585 [Candidatus Brocadiales bacterium]|nr:hypothetical protein [Candidatus Brocadiales bacterium]
MVRALGTRFTQDYKDTLFRIWYMQGKPVPHTIYDEIPKDNRGRKPQMTTFKHWCYTEFTEKAKERDEEVKKELVGMDVAIKVEMLQRHADLGKRMIDLGATYLEEHKDEITAHSAVRLLVEGWRIERESRGLPSALDKVAKMSDRDLLAEVSQLFADAPVEIESLDVDN